MSRIERDLRPTLSNTTRTCNELRIVYMCTSQVALMEMDKGTLARIDRKLLAGLGDDEAYRTLRVPAVAAKWSTWKRYCDSAGVSMGRAVTMLIDRELLSVFGEHVGDESPVFAQRATDQLGIREAKIAARERQADTDEARMREWSDHLRRREGELEARERRTETNRAAAIGSTGSSPPDRGVQHHPHHRESNTPNRVWSGRENHCGP